MVRLLCMALFLAGVVGCTRRRRLIDAVGQRGCREWGGDGAQSDDVHSDDVQAQLEVVRDGADVISPERSGQWLRTSAGEEDDDFPITHEGGECDKPCPVGSDVVGPDVGFPDAGSADAGYPDTGYPDTGYPDTGYPDAGFPDAGLPDAVAPDVGVPDGWGDAGPPDVVVVDVADASAGDVASSDIDLGDGDSGDADTGDGGPSDGDSGIRPPTATTARPLDSGQPTPMDAQASFFPSPLPRSEDEACMPPPVAPYHQVGHTLEFEIVWDTLAGLDGGAVLKDFCAGNPGVCPENGRACTKPRSYASVSLNYHVDLKLNCDKSDDKISYWDVLGVYLAGPPKDRHHTKEFKTNKLTGMTYNGEIHMFKVSDVDRELLKKLFDKIAFDEATAKLRIAAVDKMVTQTTWHERQHEAFGRKYLAARETIFNDPHYPAQVHGPTGTSLKVMRDTVINFVKSDLKKRLSRRRS